MPETWSVAGVMGRWADRSPVRLIVTAGKVTYRVAPFPKTLKPSPLVGVYTDRANIDVAAAFEAAARQIAGKCAKHRDCNEYFASLGKGLTLADLLSWNIVFFMWLAESRVGPAPGKGEPYEAFDAMVLSKNYDTKYAEIVVGETALADPTRLAATIVHELAHIAGAPGATDDDRGKVKRGTPEYKRLIAAEEALRHCLLHQHFSPGALGMIQESQGWRGTGKAFA
jgi:hypothetical protein